jgi:hypothetical protein
LTSGALLTGGGGVAQPVTKAATATQTVLKRGPKKGRKTG